MERLKLVSLAALVFQSSLLAITIRHSRTRHVDGNRYLPTTAVVMSEFFKVIISIFILAVTVRKSLLSHLISLGNDVIRCCVPAVLYTVQNNLQFVAVSYLDAATFQVTTVNINTVDCDHTVVHQRADVARVLPENIIAKIMDLQIQNDQDCCSGWPQICGPNDECPVTYQLKILTTAVFSVCFLRRHLDVIHWSSLLVLTIGVVIVQFPKSVDCPTNNKGSCDVSGGRSSGLVVGVASVLAMCVISGFAGVYTEKILKSTSNSESMWLRNLQLAVASVCIASACVYLYDGDAVANSGFFQGYDAVTWIVILQQTILGLIISFVVKYADSILKGFASSVAIIITTLMSSLVLHDLQMSCSFLMGTLMVILSALLYSMDRSVNIPNSEAVI